MADISQWVAGGWVPHSQGMVSIGITEAVVDMTASDPRVLRKMSVVQTAIRLVDEESVIRWRNQRKGKYRSISANPAWLNLLFEINSSLREATECHG